MTVDSSRSNYFARLPKTAVLLQTHIRTKERMHTRTYSKADTHTPTFAVDGDPALGRLADGKEPLDDAVVGGGAIDEEQVFVVEPSVRELLGLVHALVEANDGGDAVGTEVVEVVVRGVQGVTVLNTTLVVGPGKSKELVWGGE